MDDITKKIMLSLGAGLLKKAGIAIGMSVATHGWISGSQVELFGAAAVALGAAGYSFWNDYGRPIVLSQLEVLKAKSMAQAAKMQRAGVAQVTVSEIAAQSPKLSATDVVKTVATLPPAIQANVATVIAKVLIAAFACSMLLSFPSAMAQVKLGPVGTKIKADIEGTTQNTAVGAPPPTIKPLELIQKIAAISGPDLIYTAAMATKANTNGSQVRLKCVQAIQDLNKQISGTGLVDSTGAALTMPAEPHIFTDLEMAAEGIDALSPTGPLFTSCAGAAALAGMNVLAFINAMVAGTAAAAIVVPK